MELCSPDAAPFFLGLHRIRIFGSLHRRDLGCHFSGLEQDKSTVNKANSMEPTKITGEVLMVVMPVSNWMERKTTGTKTAPMP